MSDRDTAINFKWVCFNAAIIFALDAFVLNQGVISAITIFIFGFILLPISLIRIFWLKENWLRIKKYMIYIAAGLLVFSSNYLNNIFGQSQGNYLVEKIENYKKDNGAYPQSLSALVPKYTSSVPIAKVTIMGGFFYHLSSNGSPVLFYIVFPPFYRNGYDFVEGKWQEFE